RKTPLMAKAPKTATAPKHAMVLAAGLGTRMRPFNGRLPKPLVPVGGKALIDYVLDRLAAQGVERAGVNVHHLADQIDRHLAGRKRPKIVISDERSELLGTGGGVVKALPKLGDAPFFHVNSDTIWIDGVKPNLARLADSFDAERMDALLLLATTASSIGYSGRGGFSMAAGGRLPRPGGRGGRGRGEREVVPLVYAGAAILTPAFFADAPAGAFSMSPLFDRAAEAGRLCGLRLEGVWMHVGTPEAIAAAEKALLAGAAAQPVISRRRAIAPLCPLYPRNRTFNRTTGMSALCQKRTHAPQQRPSLFDHLEPTHELAPLEFDRLHVVPFSPSPRR